MSVSCHNIRGISTCNTKYISSNHESENRTGVLYLQTVENETPLKHIFRLLVPSAYWWTIILLIGILACQLVYVVCLTCVT